MIWISIIILCCMVLSIACLLLYRKWKQTVRLLEHEKQNRKDDRTGRIRAEQKNAQLLAQLQTTSSSNPSKSEESDSKIPFDIIGKVESVFSQKNGTPRQPLFYVPDAKGRISIFKKFQPLYSLDGLEEFSHLWILFIFHQNTNQGKETISPKVTPPRLFDHQLKKENSGKKPTIGMFATRTPHRYNPIGISCVKIDHVDAKNGLIQISGLDLVHGTPIVDIKPYISGYDNLPPSMVRNAAWLQSDTEDSSPWDSVPKRKSITWNALALQQLEHIFVEKDDYPTVHLFYPTKTELQTFISQVVSYDTRSFAQKQKQATEQSVHLCRDELCIQFTILDADTIAISKVV